LKKRLDVVLEEIRRAVRLDRFWPAKTFSRVYLCIQNCALLLSRAHIRALSDEKEMTLYFKDPAAPTWIELQRIVPLKEGAELRGTSVDSIKRNDRDKIIKLGPRRLGIRVRDALKLPDDPPLNAA
jgi:hypothetical protein